MEEEIEFSIYLTPEEIEELIDAEYYWIAYQFLSADDETWDIGKYDKKFKQFNLCDRKAITPNYVIEAGSGVSTVVIAYCLKRNGKGKIISLDHLQEYADATHEMIDMHELTQYAEVCYAPLKDVQINDEAWLWYDLNYLEIEDEIDLLVVDGPPAATQSLARYPAIPLLFDHLSKDAVFVLDDGRRQNEKDIIKRYENEFPYFKTEYLDFEKGAFVLTRTK